jgi:hypothetical protein
MHHQAVDQMLSKENECGYVDANQQHEQPKAAFLPNSGKLKKGGGPEGEEKGRGGEKGEVEEQFRPKTAAFFRPSAPPGSDQNTVKLRRVALLG